MEIQNSSTVILFEKLMSVGFNVKITNTYANNYNQDYDHLSITVSDYKDRIEELYTISKEFEMVLGRYSNSNEVFIIIRKHREYAELIKIDKLDYEKVNKREKKSNNNTTIYSYENWKTYYENIIEIQ